MTMVVDFADGFTSGSNPNLIGLGNESYPLLNNQVAPLAINGLTFANYTSVSGVIEIERYNDDLKFRQAGEILFIYDSNTGTWSFDMGSYKGDDLLQKVSIANPQEIMLFIDNSGQITYTTGNMDSDGYEGTLKLSLNRINT